MQQSRSMPVLGSANDPQPSSSQESSGCGRASSAAVGSSRRGTPCSCAAHESTGGASAHFTHANVHSPRTSRMGSVATPPRRPPPPPLPVPPAAPPRSSPPPRAPPSAPPRRQRQSSLVCGPSEECDRVTSSNTFSPENGEEWGGESVSWMPIAAQRAAAAAATVESRDATESEAELVELWSNQWEHATRDSLRAPHRYHSLSRWARLALGRVHGDSLWSSDTPTGDAGTLGDVATLTGDAATPTDMADDAPTDSRLHRQLPFVRVWPPDARVRPTCRDSAEEDTVPDAWSDAWGWEEVPRAPPQLPPPPPCAPRRGEWQERRSAVAPSSPLPLSPRPAHHRPVRRVVSAQSSCPYHVTFRPHVTTSSAVTDCGASGGAAGESSAASSAALRSGGGGGGENSPLGNALDHWLMQMRKMLAEAGESLGALGAAFSFESQRLIGSVSERLERGAARAARAAKAAAEVVTRANDYSLQREEVLRKELRQLRVVLDSQRKVSQAKDELLTSLTKMAATERHMLTEMMRRQVILHELRLDQWTRVMRRMRLLRRPFGALWSAARAGSCHRDLKHGEEPEGDCQVEQEQSRKEQEEVHNEGHLWQTDEEDRRSAVSVCREGWRETECEEDSERGRDVDLRREEEETEQRGDRERDISGEREEDGRGRGRTERGRDWDVNMSAEGNKDWGRGVDHKRKEIWGLDRVEDGNGSGERDAGRDWGLDVGREWEGDRGGENGREQMRNGEREEGLEWEKKREVERIQGREEEEKMQGEWEGSPREAESLHCPADGTHSSGRTAVSAGSVYCQCSWQSAEACGGLSRGMEAVAAALLQAEAGTGAAGAVAEAAGEREAGLARRACRTMQALNFQALRVIHVAQDKMAAPLVTTYPAEFLTSSRPSGHIRSRSSPPCKHSVTSAVSLTGCSPAAAPPTRDSLSKGFTALAAAGPRKGRSDTWMAHILVPVRRVSLPRVSTQKGRNEFPTQMGKASAETHSASKRKTPALTRNSSTRVSSYFPAPRQD